MKDPQTVGWSVLALMTVINLVLMVLMLTCMPVWLGMSLSFAIMGMLVALTSIFLLGNKPPWK